jgi:hypothetical protein
MKAARPAYGRDYCATLPYRVVIIAGAKHGLWGRFPTIEAAAAVAARMRQHGMMAVVEHDEATA